MHAHTPTLQVGFSGLPWLSTDTQEAEAKPNHDGASITSSQAVSAELAESKPVFADRTRGRDDDVAGPNAHGMACTSGSPSPAENKISRLEGPKTKLGHEVGQSRAVAVAPWTLRTGVLSQGWAGRVGRRAREVTN
ncbi:hypothetical protein AK830_g1035 [Neonectria ditissima]|uniref:Uncharacterized protein n=1 Tax=Neonectria ditissima TaxID=78410 RepID=A0A0P7BXI5_9HYPO|nr:hypothetical protein AK830_g1035 [Neonectria ditissima]